MNIKRPRTIPERDELENFFPRRMIEPELPIDHEFDFDNPNYDL